MIKVLKNFNKKDYGIMLLCVVLMISQVWLELKIPEFMSKITNMVQTGTGTMGEILLQGVFMLSCSLVSLATAIIIGYFAALLSATLSLRLRSKIFNKVESFGMQEIRKFSTSSLITRTTNDVTQIEMTVAMGLQMMIKAPIMAVWAISKILNKSMVWSSLTGLGVLILLATITTIMIIVIPRFERVQKLTDKVNGVTGENLSGIRVIHAFNAEKYQEERFDKVNSDLTRTQLFNQRMFSIMNPVMMLVNHTLTLGIYFFGALLISEAAMTDKITLFSDMVVFSSYGMQVIMSFLVLAFIFMLIPRAQISAKRINAVLDEENSIKDGTFEGETEEKGKVVFKNVSFKYPDADANIIEDISFTANKGETVAFIGSTGSGKSTLINLVPRFYDVTEGEILIDGINVKDYKQETLNNKIGYISQKAIMFTGSVKENISYGDNGREKPDEEKVTKALEVAQALDFVNKMDGKLNAHVARGGTNISGGQKQRLSIARAIARDPEIYIFDDSFSALDYKTDATLREELRKYTKDATSLIVAQRIGTIINADKIVVLDKGKCVGIGTHKELLKNCKVYQEIALSQLSKEELENA